MRQVNVDLDFDETDNPVTYRAEDDSVEWDYDDVECADWKDTQGQVEASSKATKEGFETVILFDGSDTVIFASMKDAKY